MINPMVADLRGPRTTLLVANILLKGFDFTGAVFRLQVRPYALSDVGGAPSSPIANLATVSTASAEGVRLASVTGSGATVATLLGVRFNKTTMATMPAAPEPGDAAQLAWDLLITPAGGVEERYMRGRFIVEPGVTV